MGGESLLDTKGLGIDGVLMITPARHQDGRGFFSEVYNRRHLAAVGIDDDFVQDNHSLSSERGTVRGLHFQVDPHPIAKLVRVTRGAVWDVVVDLRESSPTYGEHVGAELTAENWVQLYVPVGFAHGFCTLEPDTELVYKVTDYWSPQVDKGVAWDDPDLDLPWPVDRDKAVLSDKDRSQPKLADLPSYFGGER